MAVVRPIPAVEAPATPYQAFGQSPPAPVQAPSPSVTQTQQFPQTQNPVPNVTRITGSPVPSASSIPTGANQFFQLAPFQYQQPLSSAGINQVSPAAVGGRDATIEPFKVQSPASQIFSAPNATWGQYELSRMTPGQSGLNVDSRMAQMMGNQAIKSPLPAITNGSGLSHLIGLLGGLLPAAAAIGPALGQVVSAVSSSTGGNATSSAQGGQGGTANVGPVQGPPTPRQYAGQQYYQQALNPYAGGAGPNPMGWGTGGSLTFGGPVAGYGGGGGGGSDPSLSDPWFTDPSMNTPYLGTNSIGSNTPGQFYAGSQPNMTGTYGGSSGGPGLMQIGPSTSAPAPGAMGGPGYTPWYASSTLGANLPTLPPLTNNIAPDSYPTQSGGGTNFTGANPSYGYEFGNPSSLLNYYGGLGFTSPLGAMGWNPNQSGLWNTPSSSNGFLNYNYTGNPLGAPPPATMQDLDSTFSRYGL